MEAPQPGQDRLQEALVVVGLPDRLYGLGEHRRLDCGTGVAVSCDGVATAVRPKGVGFPEDDMADEAVFAEGGRGTGAAATSWVWPPRMRSHPMLPLSIGPPGASWEQGITAAADSLAGGRIWASCGGPVLCP